MRATRMFVGVVAAFALSLSMLACGGKSQREIIESFINDTPAVDLSDRGVVERAAYHSQPDWVILESLVGMAFLLNLEEDSDCPAVIDRSDPDAGTTEVEYRGDGCVREDNGQTIKIDGRMSLSADRVSQRVEYHDLVLTIRDEQTECTDLPYTARLRFMGTVTFPADEEARQGAVAGDYEILVKHDISVYTDECELVQLILAHVHEIQIRVMDTGQEQMIINQHGRTAMENHEFTDPALDYDVLAGSFSVEREDLLFEPAVCAEPTGGSIRLSAGDDTAAIEPNGAVDCDSDHCAPWILNGEAQPEPVCGLEGVGCQASTRAQGGLGVLLLLAVCSLFLLFTVSPRRRVGSAKKIVRTAGSLQGA